MTILKNRGAAHWKCNINLKISKKTSYDIS